MPTCRPSRRLDRAPPRPGTTAQGAKFARFGDNMREVAVTEGDKVAAQTAFGYAVNGYGVGDLVERVEPGVATPRSTGSSAEYEEQYALPRRCGGRQHGTNRCVTARRIEIGLRALSGGGRLQGLHRYLRGSARPGAAPGHRRAAADGRWLRLWRRRRLEDGGAGARDEGHGARPAGRHVLHGGLHLPPRAGRPKVLGAHMLEICPTIAADKPSLEIHPLGIGGKADPVRLVFTRTHGPGAQCLAHGHGQSLPHDRQRGGRRVSRTQPLPKLPVARALWMPEPDLKTAAAAWIYAGGAHHTGFSQALTAEHLEDFAEMAGIE